MSSEQDQIVPLSPTAAVAALDPEILKTPPEPAAKKLKQTTLDDLFTPDKLSDKPSGENSEKKENPLVVKKRKIKKITPASEIATDMLHAEVVKHDEELSCVLKPKVVKPRAKKEKKGEPKPKKEKKEGEQTEGPSEEKDEKEQKPKVTKPRVKKEGEAKPKKENKEGEQTEGESEEKVEKEPKKPKEKIKIPPRIPGNLKDMRGFQEHARVLNIPNPSKAFSHIRGAILCGIFERVAPNVLDDIFTTDSAPSSPVVEKQAPRLSTDLPEMTTCCKYDEGRYAVWKDDPKQEEILIVHVTKDEHFPTITVIGDRWEHLLFHLAKAEYDIIKDLLPTGYSKNRLWKETREVIHDRADKMMGSFTGVGYIVPIVGTSENPHITAVSELKRVIEALGENVAILKERSVEQMEVLHECVEDASSEEMFGMTLELGHMLWLSNYHNLNEKAKNYLVDAYTRLGRDAYAQIVTDHYEKKEEEWKKKEEKKTKKVRLSWAGTEEAGERRYFTRAQVRNLMF